MVVSKCLLSVMRKVEILIDGGVSLALSEAMLRAISLYSPETEVRGVDARLASALSPSDILFCPLTWDLSPNQISAFSPIYQVCQEDTLLRQWVEKSGMKMSQGGESLSSRFWLPVVWTARGPLYAEAIGIDPNSPSSYIQPLHLSDIQRQAIYQFSFNLLTHFEATPATYFLQWGEEEAEFYFERLWPFPIEPALASIDVQTPDLLTCHWLCLNNLPIYDLTISHS